MSLRPITPEQFIGLARLMNADAQEAVKCLRAEAWPDFEAVAKHAEEQADDLPCCEENEAEHEWLMGVADWAKRRTD